MNTRSIIFIIILLIIPYFIQVLCRRISFFNFIGSVIACFLLGLLLGNFVPSFLFDKSAVKSFYEILVPLGIVMMLLTTDISKWLKASLKTLFAYVLQVGSVVIAAICSFFVFRGHLTGLPDITGMLSATYIGGTPNMSAVKIALGSSEDLFAEVFIADMVASSIYLIFIMVFAGRIFRHLLPSFTVSSTSVKEESNDKVLFSSLSLLKRMRNVTISIIIALIVTFFPIVLHKIFLDRSEPINMVFLMLSITVFAILLSFIKPIRIMPGSFEAGDYLFNIFFLSLGTLVSFKDIITINTTLLFYTSCILYGSFLLHFLFVWIFKIDRDTFILTSVAGIMSPPFIPAVASALKNKAIIVPAMVASIGGLALGNFIGIILATILSKYI
ncbi:MAG: DUF819 family protein [Flavobacteriales bacterium]|nr:DUF819 family protein [Flavobacteriales bacterium]MCZ2443019.1 DUF819 family protein [Flavobacteriales bacterium]